MGYADGRKVRVWHMVEGETPSVPLGRHIYMNPRHMALDRNFDSHKTGLPALHW